MKKEIIEKIEEEIERLLGKLGELQPDTNEYKEVATRIGNLYETINKEKELEINMYKVDVESTKVELDRSIRNEENLNKIEELKQSKIFNGLKTGIEITTIVAPLVFYGIWMNRGLEFEKEGSYTSTTFKGLIGKFKPTK